MNIAGLGPAMGQICRGLIHDPADLYRALWDLVGLERLGPKSAQNLLKALEKVKKSIRLIFALGIRHVGEQAAKILASVMIPGGDMDATEEELMVIPEIGPRIASSIVAFLRGQNRQVIKLVRPVLTSWRRKISAMELGRLMESFRSYRYLKDFTAGKHKR